MVHARGEYIGVREVLALTVVLQAVLDDETKKSRYSILKSAATIALLSIAIGAVAATAGAALLPEVGAVRHPEEYSSTS